MHRAGHHRFCVSKGITPVGVAVATDDDDNKYLVYMLQGCPTACQRATHKIQILHVCLNYHDIR